MNDKALQGIRVLDLTNVLAGPLCAYQLALLGADVIKVEVPESGDLARQLGSEPKLNAERMGASFLAQNGGKRSLTLNLKQEEGKAVLRRLVATADVLVENFRPGVMERLGLSYETLREVNPRLVYCAITGFGQEGPMRDAPAYDQIIQGLSGMMSVTGDAKCAPLRAGYPVADTISGIMAAFAISAALVRRNASGQGAFVDVSMLDSALVSMGWVISNFLIAGTQPQPHGNDNFTAAPSGTFRTGAGLLNIAANKQEQFEALCKVVGREDLVFDERFARRESRKQNRAALTVELERALAAHPASHWEKVLVRAGVPSGAVLSLPQALDLEQVAVRGLLQEFPEVPGTGRAIKVARTGFKLSGADPEASLPPPRLGEHTDALLAELGYSAADIAALRKDGTV
ncbi:CoA transferase [Ramlibacter sp. USB13]|uniref:CoA transferase n=1 Tax=Ramlibacter cellulosilyticus TaxID=2764187 RepID=A0A923SC18_9BURK|nr:CoA transferase [Ramlibacter cellulosilyticus]MBC5784465.1 CoA transferase [Ramlibacter cellulosilyticus]